MLAAAEERDVVVLGETHYDAIAHKLQEVLFARLATSRHSVTLSLEMFETDVQHVMDEYLAGLIREQDMRNDARPWANYEAHYRPLVEMAKAAGLPVVAANAPRRYVSATGRDGEDALTRSGRPWTHAYAYLPPLPLPAPSAAYVARMEADDEVVPKGSGSGCSPGDEQGTPSMRGSATEGCPFIGFRKGDTLVAPMRLWDATMAHSIAEALRSDHTAQVVHVCGSDHSLGVVELLGHYCHPAASTIIINMYPEDDCSAFVPARHGGGRADFVVLTDASVST